MEVKINQVVLHLLDPGASEPVLSDRAMDMDADLYEYYTATVSYTHHTLPTNSRV